MRPMIGDRSREPAQRCVVRGREYWDHSGVTRNGTQIRAMLDIELATAIRATEIETDRLFATESPVLPSTRRC